MKRLIVVISAISLVLVSCSKSGVEVYPSPQPVYNGAVAPNVTGDILLPPSTNVPISVGQVLEFKATYKLFGTEQLQSVVVTILDGSTTLYTATHTAPSFTGLLTGADQYVTGVETWVKPQIFVPAGWLGKSLTLRIRYNGVTGTNNTYTVGSAFRVI